MILSQRMKRQDDLLRVDKKAHQNQDRNVGWGVGKGFSGVVKSPGLRDIVDQNNAVCVPIDIDS